MGSSSNLSYPVILADIGWQPFFQQQLSLEEYETARIARVLAHHRNVLLLATCEEEVSLEVHVNLPPMTVGDWVLLDAQWQFLRLLQRKSLFSRKASGERLAQQLIAANLDSVFIVSSLNNDFNLNRIERYLALAHCAQVEPIVVLSKADLCAEVELCEAQVQALDPLLNVFAVNALSIESVSALLAFLAGGKTVAVLGSSGVGKSTLVNSLLGETTQETGAIRQDDSKGRHTTTSRSIHALPAGGLLLDTPGMRELQLADCEEGVSATFADLEELASACRFADCAHFSEPGCAVRKAIEDGDLEERRLINYQKLQREQLRNGASLAQQRRRDKAFGRMVKHSKNEKNRNKNH